MDYQSLHRRSVLFSTLFFIFGMAGYIPLAMEIRSALRGFSKTHALVLAVCWLIAAYALERGARYGKNAREVARIWKKRFRDTEFLLRMVGDGVLTAEERKFIGQGWGKIPSEAPITREKAEMVGYILQIGSVFIAEMVHRGVLRLGDPDAEGKTTLCIGPAVFDAAKKNFPLKDFQPEMVSKGTNVLFEEVS